MLARYMLLSYVHPQGSVLGPLLFVIYINDIPDLSIQQDTHTKIYLYMDDAKIYNYKVINQMPDHANLQAIVKCEYGKELVK